jgi:hypothetical protein
MPRRNDRATVADLAIRRLARGGDIGTRVDPDFSDRTRQRERRTAERDRQRVLARRAFADRSWDR